MNEQFILSVIEKFGSAKIDELVLHEGNLHLTLRKGLIGANLAPSTDSSAPASQKQGETQSGPSVHLGIPAGITAESQGGGESILSPIVATYYSSPSPDSPAFVKPGSKVKAGDTLCILEAMKMMNHLEAEFDCEIIEIHAVSGDLVEYDQLLFTVKRL